MGCKWVGVFRCFLFIYTTNGQDIKSEKWVSVIDFDCKKSKNNVTVCNGIWS